MFPRLFLLAATFGGIVYALFGSRKSPAAVPPATPLLSPYPPGTLGKAEPYLEAIGAAERQYGLPEGLLFSVLYQESRFRPDIIDGRLKSSAGAVGIAQLIPKWHPDVDPLDPEDSIFYAAKILAGWKDQFGDWEHALAAYNWGPSILAQKGLEAAPTSTREKYIPEILSRIA